MKASEIYGIKMVRPEAMIQIIPPPPPTMWEIIAGRLHSALMLGLVCIFGALAVTIAPVQTIGAFLVAFVIGMSREKQ